MAPPPEDPPDAGLEGAEVGAGVEGFDSALGFESDAADVADPDPVSALAAVAFGCAVAFVYRWTRGRSADRRFVATLVKRDPNAWHEMKQVLPLLAQPEYYARLKSGAARGGEAVIMTENIRTYYDILRRHEKAASGPQAFPMTSMAPM